MTVGQRWMLAIAAANLLLPSAAWAQADLQSEERRSAVEANAIARRNAEIVRRYIDVTNRHDVAAAVRFFADDTVNHGVPTGRAGVERVLTDIYATFPDWRMEIIDLVAVGDEVVVREIVSGTHLGTGPYRGEWRSARQRAADGEAFHHSANALVHIQQGWPDRQGPRQSRRCWHDAAPRPAADAAGRPSRPPAKPE